MVTTETEYDQVVKALAAGASEYVMKPFTKDIIMDKLDMLGVAPEESMVAPRTPPRRIAQAAAASPYAERGKPGTRIRVLVTDDSAVMRRLVSEAVQSDPSCEVVGTANNGSDALAKIEALRPDIVTLDIEMPVMNGLETLIPLRKAHPRLPVIMFSTLTERGARRDVRGDAARRVRLRDQAVGDQPRRRPQGRRRAS